MTVTAAAPDRVVRRPGTEVVSADPSGAAVRVALSDSTELSVDYIVFAAAIEPTCATSRTCNASLGQVELVDGFPALDNAMQTTLDGLYLPAFSATRDFGPFFGFVKGSPAPATLVVRDLIA